MKANEVAVLLMNRLKATKRVSRLNIEEGELTEYLYTIDIINDLSVYDRYISDKYLIDDYVIPTFLKDMIYPSLITITGTRLGMDFCSRPFRDDESTDKTKVIKIKATDNTAATYCKVLSPFEFNNITDLILNALRSDDKGVTVSSQRNEVLVTEVCKRASYNGYTMYNGVFYPVQLKINPYLRESLLNTSEQEMVELWLNEILR